MSVLWITIVSLHILAAVTWIGGMLFLSLVLAPLVRGRKSTAETVALFRSSARRFRPVVWVAMALLITTGPFLLAEKNIAVSHPSSWPQIALVKVGLVAGLVLLTFAHDLLMGHKGSRIMATSVAERARWRQWLTTSVRWLPRLSVLLAVAIIVAAVILSRS